MADQGTGGDSIAIYLSGAASAGGAQADPDAALGGHRSSTRACGLRCLLPVALPGVRIDFVSGANGTGQGTLHAASADSLIWTPPGGEGAAAEVADGETKLVAGGDRSKFVVVTRTSAEDLAGDAVIDVVETYNDVLGQSDQDSPASVTYRCVVLKNGSGERVRNLKVWLGDCTHGVRVAIEQPASQPDGAFQTTADETTAPTGLTFVAPTSAADGSVIAVASLPVGHQVAIWVERSPSTYASEVLADAPVGYWRLGEASGSTATSETGAHDGTYEPSSGGAWTGGTLGVAGALAGSADRAVTTDGATGGIEMPGNAAFDFGTGDFTVEAWVKTASAGTVLAVARIQSGVNDWWLGANGGASTFSMNSFGAPGAAVNNGAWHHVVGRRTSGVVSVTVDGVVTTGAVSAGSVSMTNADPVRIGRRTDGFHWPGSVDDVAIYAGSLSTARILAHYKAGLGRTATARGRVAINWSYTARA